MNKYIKLSSIVNHMQGDILNRIGAQRMIAQAYNAYNALGITQKYERLCKLVCIENYTVQIDMRYDSIADVIYYSTAKDCDSLHSTCALPNSLKSEEVEELMNIGETDLIRRYADIGCTFYYQIAQQSLFCNSNEGIRMGYVSADVNCADCTDSPHLLRYTVDAQGVVRTNIENGYAMISYDALPTCGDDFLIIDSQDIIEYLRNHITHTYYMNNLSELREIGGAGMLQMLHRQKDIMRAKVTGQYVVRGANQRAIKQAVLGSKEIFANKKYFNTL